MTPEEAKLVAQQYADVVEAKGKAAREKYGVRALYAAFGAGGVLVVEGILWVVFHGWVS